MASDEVRELIERIVKAIVDRRDQVEIKAVESGHSVIYEVRVAKADTGKVIGRNGRTINAIRTILAATWAQKERRYVIEVLE